MSYDYDDHPFFENVKNLIDIGEMEQKIEQMFFVFQIITFELPVAISSNLEQDICHWQSMCEQLHLRFHLTLRV